MQKQINKHTSKNKLLNTLKLTKHAINGKIKHYKQKIL